MVNFGNTIQKDSCPHSELCGGCIYQGLDMAEQLEIKNATVLKFILEEDIRVSSFVPIRQIPSIYAYRNKMEYTFADETKGGPMTLGLHKKGSYMSVINTDYCQIVPEDFNLIRRMTLEFMAQRGYSFFHKRTHTGLLRNLVIRRGENTNQLLINILTSSQGSFAADEYADMLLSMDLEGEIVGIVHSIYDGKADKVAADSMNLLYGTPYYYDELLGLRFKVGALSFFQTNTKAAERLLAEATGLITNEFSAYVANSSRTPLSLPLIYDLYCGTGIIGLAISEGAREVIGIDIVADSINSAETNATENGITNTRFLCADALEALSTLKAPDILILDPPRMGIHPKALKKILSYGLNEILYISCNPKTWANDVAVMQKQGYKVDIIQVYDNFPFTKHIELISRIVLEG